MAKKGFWDYALTSGLSTGIGKSKKPQAPGYEPYNGYKPPHVGYLRPVEDQIAQTLMERSKGQGQGIGFDPARRNELLQSYDIQQKRDQEKNNADLQNRISGMGSSRNPAVYDELIGRANRDAADNRQLYTNAVDTQDLEQRNKDVTHATDQLQNLNTMNFGQENQVANFDRAIYNDQNNQQNQAYQNQMAGYQDPLGTALQVAGTAGGLYADYNTAGMYGALKNAASGTATTTPAPYSAGTVNGGGVNNSGYPDAYGDILNQLALKNGYQLKR